MEKDTKIGYIYTYLDGKLVNRSDLIAKSSIGKASIMQRLFEKIMGK